MAGVWFGLIAFEKVTASGRRITNNWFCSGFANSREEFAKESRKTASGSDYGEIVNEVYYRVDDASVSEAYRHMTK